MAKQSSEIVKASDYAITKSKADPAELIAANLGGEDLSPFDLPRIRVPAGGGLAWSVPTVEGEVPMPDVTGVIVFTKLGRVYWAAGLEEGGGNQPPDCVSEDNVQGVGEPGGKCGECPQAKFGSDPKGGRGQACKQTRQLFVIRPTDTLLPCVVSVPPTSLRAAKQYLIQVLNLGLSYCEVVTKLTLRKTQNAGGISYSEIEFTFVGELPDGARSRFMELRSSLAPVLAAVPVATD